MSNLVFIIFFLNNYHNHYKLNIQNIRLLNIVVTSFSVRDDWIKIGLTTKDIGVSEPEFKNRKIEAQVLKTTTRRSYFAILITSVADVWLSALFLDRPVAPSHGPDLISL